MNPTSSKNKNVPSIVCLILISTLCCLGWIDAFFVPNSQNCHSRNSVADSSSRAYELNNVILPQHQQRYIATIDTRRMATVESDSMATPSSSSKDGESKKMGMGKQVVLFQKVVRPTQDMPDVMFLGYLIEYLERHFELPSDLPMTYENMVINDNDNNNDNFEQQHNEDRYTLAWDSPLSPSADATRMEVEVVGIYTDDNKKKNDESSASSPSPSVPNMAMVVVRRPNIENNEKKQKAVPAMMKGLFDDSEKRIIKALDRGLDDFVAGKIRFEMNDDLAEERTRGEIPPANVKTAQEAIDAELVDDYPSALKDDFNKIAPEDVVFDAYATTNMEENKNDKTKTSSEGTSSAPTKEKKQRTTQEISDAKARAMATMQKPAEETRNKKESGVASNSNDNKTAAGVGFGVDAAKKGAYQKENEANNVAAPNESAAGTVDYAVEAARKAAALRKQKQSSSPSSTTEPKEDFAVATARKMAASATQKGSSNNKKAGSKKVRGATPDAMKEPQMTTGPSMPPIPDGWKPKDYFQDQRVFSGTISRPKTASKKTKRTVKAVTQPPPQRASTVASQTDSMKEIGNRKLNAKIINKGDSEDDASITDPLLEQNTSSDTKKPSKKDVEAEIMKAAKIALDEIEGENSEMTAEEMLKDVLKFDEEQKKEEQPGSGFVSGAFEKAKELMKDRHRQIQERKKQEQLGFKEMEKSDPDSFPKQPSPVEAKHELTPEEELKQMFAAGQKIAEGKITTNTEDTGGSIQASGTTEADVDRLIAEEKTVSKYARILDDELAELEVRINSSPGEELDGPQQNPMFDVMSGPEVYDPNVELDAVNYPGSLPGTADVKLPKQLDEAIKQAEFAAGVLMEMEVRETKDETTGQTSVKYFAGKRELTTQQVENLQKVVEGAVKSGIIGDPVEIMAEASRLQLVLDELWNQPEERFYEIASSYKDLLLSDRFVLLIRERLRVMADRDLDALRNDDESLREPHEKERELLGRLVNYAQGLLKETRALGAELEAHQLEIVRSICKVAMDPDHTTEEETAMALSDAVRDMRPLLDDAFVAYLKYAVAEEESKLARAGLLDDPDYNQWLFVLKIVQQGVYAEIAKGINRYIDHIGYVLRMNSPQQRRQLLSDLIDDMPTMDVRPFVQVVDNIVGSLGDSVNGNFDGLVPLGEMTNTLLQLQNDVREFLPPERIAEKSKDADEWAAKQKKRLLKMRQVGEQRLEAATLAAQREEDVDAVFGDSGEVDRFD